MHADEQQQTRAGGLLGLSRTIIVLGLVSLFTDLSTEMLVPILPLFLKNVLFAPVLAIGFIEGVAESIASLLRVYAGWLADKFGRPKLLAVLGYGLSSVSKPFLALATAWPQVFAVRFADRFGKGIRSAPRDVIIAEAADPSIRGRAFGFHRAMDTTGAVLGPLAALAIIPFFAHESARAPFVAVFLISAIPALIAVAILAIFVPEKPKRSNIAPPRIQWGTFSPSLKKFLIVVAIFSIGNSSDAFIILRANNLGYSVGSVLWIYVLFNAVSAVFSLPAGILSDKVGRRPVVVAGMLVFAVTYLGFAVAKDSSPLWLLFAVYGLYYGLTAGALRAYAADLAPRELRGTVIGAYYTLEGICLLPASVIAGFLWSAKGSAAPFYYGAATALLAAFMLWALVRQDRTANSTSGV